jgi:signal transduction histidine kinase
MDYLQKFTAEIRNRLILMLLLNNCVIILAWFVTKTLLELTLPQALAVIGTSSLVAQIFFAWITAKFLAKPTETILRAVLHIAPHAPDIIAPDLTKISLGRELITTLVSNVYQIANVFDSVEATSKTKASDLSRNFLANSLPLPVAVLNPDDTIVFANAAMQEYLQLPPEEITGNNIYSVINMSFTSEQTFSNWLTKSKNGSVTSANNWRRVKMDVPRSQSHYICDLAAYYNRDNPQKLETIVVFFDHTHEYSQDDQAVSFIALAVHELRTPLTLMRGYIEVFEEELEGKLNAEQTEFMHRLKDSAQQLTAFTNNILNVSRFDNDQLILKMREENWPDIIASAVRDLRLRAKLRGIDVVSEIAPDLPTVGVDRTSIYEVVSNLVDNAIKYSGTSKKIVVKTQLNSDSNVETVVQDFGVGIPEPAMANIFDKYYRDFHNRAQVGGTGMGLYLSKGIVKAHGGNIWVRSKEGQGSEFGFSIIPFAKLAESQKNGNDAGITQTAHGWIKNHSMYRR